VQDVAGQLLWAPQHATQQRTREGVWVAPPGGAIWVPPMVAHKAHLLGPFFRFEVAPDVCQRLPARTCIAPVTPALRDGMLATLDASERGQDTSALAAVFERELRDSGLPALRDPFPLHSDASFLVRCEAQEPRPRSLAGWARLVGTTPLELSRQLEADLGMGFSSWQRHERLLRGVQLLAAGHDVAEAGRLAGYRSTGHWITMFKQTTGTTPGRYFTPLSRASQAPPAALEGLPRASATTRPTHTSPSPSSGFRVSHVNPDEGRRTRIHHHPDGELLWPSKAMSLTTEAGTWVGHEHLALWVPPGVPHETQAWGGHVRVYGIRDGLCVRLPGHACPLRVTPALGRALSDLSPSGEPELGEAAAETFFAAAEEQSLLPLPLRLLRPERTAPLVDALRLDPSLDWSQGRWAEHLGLGRSTLARACEDELGMPFGKLRRIMQVRRAVEHLALGKTVQQAARLVGYAHVPKFIAMFRSQVGTTPARYIRTSRGAATRG
jgi:AraC-like DNA-binding protein